MISIISLSKSFGKFVPIGREVLENNGYKLVFPPEGLDLKDEGALVDFLNKSNFKAIIAGTSRIGSLIMNACKNLEIIAKHGVGIDNIDIDYATENNIVVTNCPDSNIESVAELTVSLMLSISRKIPVLSSKIKSGNWKVILGQEMFGKTVGMLGTGKIGKSVIKKLSGFSVKIIAHDIIKDAEIADFYKVEYVDKETVFKDSDYVLLHIPLNKKTFQLVGEDLLKLMKHSAFLINTSRGAIVDEEALYDFLSAEKIAGAAIDVWENEPLNSISKKIAQLDNVIPTPHVGAYTIDALNRTGLECANAIIDFFSNKKPKYLLNQEVFEKLKN
jgi:D-3-phosphoglycerate dehydrogenase